MSQTAVYRSSLGGAEEEERSGLRCSGSGFRISGGFGLRFRVQGVGSGFKLQS